MKQFKNLSVVKTMDPKGKPKYGVCRAVYPDIIWQDAHNAES